MNRVLAKLADRLPHDLTRLEELIAKGVYFLHEASRGNKISKYHLEASIAYWHTIKADTKEKWETILQLYNQLLIIFEVLNPVLRNMF